MHSEIWLLIFIIQSSKNAFCFPILFDTNDIYICECIDSKDIYIGE